MSVKDVSIRPMNINAYPRAVVICMATCVGRTTCLLMIPWSIMPFICALLTYIMGHWNHCIVLIRLAWRSCCRLTKRAAPWCAISIMRMMLCVWVPYYRRIFDRVGLTSDFYASCLMFLGLRRKFRWMEADFEYTLLTTLWVFQLNCLCKWTPRCFMQSAFARVWQWIS